MKKYLFSILSLAMILASGCSQDEIVQEQIIPSADNLFTAYFEQNDSRTYLESGKYLRWTTGDELSIFMGTTLNNQYRFTGETGDNSGGFEPASSPGFVTGNNLDNPCHYAVYPYNKGTKISESGVLTVNLPAEQSYAENSFGVAANTMVAVTSSLNDMNLAFKNACGYLKLKFYGNDITVKNVTLQSNGGEKLSGSATLTAAHGMNPSITMSSKASDIITLDCGETGVKIGSTKEEATEFWFVLPETSFSQGFTLTIDDINGGRFVKTTSKNIIVERNVIKPISAFEVKIEDTTPYITFKADAEQPLTMSNAVETLEYSVNDGEWKELGTNIVTFGGNNGDLRLRGKNKYGTSGNNQTSQIKFSENTFVSCTGDIRTLVDFENYDTVNTSEAKFASLFGGCVSLTTAPKLPATTLADDCYNSMFFGCTNLTTAPELPATTLTSYCYQYMFRKCSNLTVAPKLPATMLAQGCYYGMFYDCKNLTTSPELPATTLAHSCYSGMFMNCVELIIPPKKLSALTLANNCYFYMFKGCNKLETAPEILATTVAGNLVVICLKIV